jgi:hypothetical protein
MSLLLALRPIADNISILEDAMMEAKYVVHDQTSVLCVYVKELVGSEDALTQSSRAAIFAASAKTKRSQ